MCSNTKPNHVWGMSFFHPFFMDALRVLVQLPIFWCQWHKMNCVGHFLWVWWAEVQWHLFLGQWAIWHSQNKVWCVIWGGVNSWIRSHTQFTRCLPSPGFFPPLKYICVYWFIQGFWIQWYHTSKRDTASAISTMPLSLVTAFSIWNT